MNAVELTDEDLRALARDPGDRSPDALAARYAFDRRHERVGTTLVVAALATELLAARERLAEHADADERARLERGRRPGMED